MTKLRQRQRAKRLTIEQAWLQTRSAIHNARRRFFRRQQERSIFTDLVEKMTNWERTQWARAGYPGLRSKDVKQLQPYAAMAQQRIALGVGRPVR